MSTNIRASLRSYFSIEFITSAAFFAQAAYKIEQTDKEDITRHQKDKHRAYVLGSVVFSITFLEALVNELAADYGDNKYHHLTKIDNGAHTSIGQSWNENTFPTSILKKYQHTLILAEKALFDKGKNPYQNVYFLKLLRNAVIHYQPEEIEVLNTNPEEELDTHIFEKRLKGKFVENPFFSPESNAFYPDRCLGHGCAEWAVQSAIVFVNSFFEKLGIESFLQERWNNLKTKTED
jgi:hypothetical protein